MAGMRVSVSGLFSHIEEALRQSRSDLACMNAYALMELGDNLRLVAEGKATPEEFFALYTFSHEGKLADLVKKERYLCMRD